MDKETKNIISKSPNGIIRIVLDGDKDIYTSWSLKDFHEQLNNKDTYIVTPLTTAIDNFYCLKGYRVIIESEGKVYCLNDMLLGINTNDNEREMRLAHRAERMFLSGCYEIKTDWTKK